MQDWQPGLFVCMAVRRLITFLPPSVFRKDHEGRLSVAGILHNFSPDLQALETHMPEEDPRVQPLFRDMFSSTAEILAGLYQMELEAWCVSGKGCTLCCRCPLSLCFTPFAIVRSMGQTRPVFAPSMIALLAELLKCLWHTECWVTSKGLIALQIRKLAEYMVKVT